MAATGTAGFPTLKFKGSYVLGHVALAMGVIAIVVGWTWRDAGVVSGCIFFATPWLTRLGLALAAMILLGRRAAWRFWLAALLAAHAMWMGTTSFHWRAAAVADSPEPAFEVLLWNTGRKLSLMPETWPGLVGSRTQLVVINEAGEFSQSQWQNFTSAQPGMNWERMGGGILVGTRAPRSSVKQHPGSNLFQRNRFNVEIAGHPITVIAVDIPGQPWILRSQYLDSLRDVADRERCMILGDFNTPPCARGFDAWRAHWHLANAAHSRGFIETWAYGLPLLTLDQLWLSYDLVALNATRTVTRHSDHAQMRFWVKIR